MKYRQKVLLILWIILAFLILAAGVCIYMILDSFNIAANDPKKAFEISSKETSKLDQLQTASSESNDLLLEYDVMLDGKIYEKKSDSVNIVLLGFDDVEDRPNDGGNTDSIIIINIDFETGEIDLISIPRDTWTKVNEYDIDSNLEYFYHTKINAAYMAAANKDDRYQNALDTIESLLEVDTFDLDTHYYCAIDIKDISKICDSVGGIPIILDCDVKGLGEKGEYVMLNNKYAETYLRDRSTAGGDLDRARRHREFMIALLRRVQDLGGKKAALSLYNDVIKYVNTNLNMEQIIALSSLSSKVDIDNIDMITIPGETGTASYERPGNHYGEKRYVYFADEQALKALIASVYYRIIEE